MEGLTITATATGVCHGRIEVEEACGGCFRRRSNAALHMTTEHATEHTIA